MAKRSELSLKRLDSISDNGLYFKDVYIPQEIVTLILSYLDGEDLLKCSLVCRKWYNIVRSNHIWYAKYEKRFGRKPRKLPWYIYFAYFYHGFFDTNLIKNGNGDQKFKHWKIIANGGDKFKVESRPDGADELPEGVEEFGGKTSCFATSYRPCKKVQEIRLAPLCSYILDVHKPHIYVSEWMAGRFDCGCTYLMSCGLYGKDYKKFKSSPTLYSQDSMKTVKQWEGREWTKIDMTLKDCPDGVKTIVFLHEGRDTQFWAGHYGPKMAGAVVKVLFDTITESIGEEEID